MFGGQILAFSPAGAVERAVDVPGTPAGLGWDADERLVTVTADGHTLVVAESAGQRLTAFTLTPDGQLRDRRVCASCGRPATAATLPGVLEQVSVWPDGIALDAAGAIWVANPFGHEVFRVLPGGQCRDRIGTGELSAYACALGGPDGRPLYICAAPPSLDETARRAQRSARLLAARVAMPAADHRRPGA